MENGRRHTCQAARFAHFFPDDTGESGANDGSWCESGGDSGYSTPEDPNAEDSDIEELPLSISFRPTLLTSTPPRRPRRPQEPSRRPLEAERTLLEHLPRRPLEAQRTLGTLTANALPSRIWDSPWTPPEYNGTEFNLTNFKATVYTETIVAPPEHLYISGTSFTEGKEALKDAMDMAISRNDWSQILATRREFSITPSFGEGTELEVLNALLNDYIHPDHIDAYLTESVGGFYILVCHTSFIGNISPQRIRNLKHFGAAVGLQVLNSRWPAKLSPAMLLFIIYDFDLNCLTPSFVGEWFPSIRTVILDWLDMGPEGNPCTPAFDGFLATYLNIRPQAYLRRDAITHNNIAVEMLFKSLLGGNIHRSPEWVAFAEGFNMHCRNG
ncbi:hypothetical protein H0H93_012410, partial [Arthromyces matolae]